MKLKRIHLKEYKRFNNLTIDLGDTPARIIALVGPNGCGKSSVFDAMLYTLNTYTYIGNTNRKDYTYHSLMNNPGYSCDNVVLEFENGSFNSIFQEKRKLGLQNTIFSFRSSFRYNGKLDVKEAKAVSEIRENNYGASSASDIDQRIEQNYRRIQIKYNNYLHDTDCKPSEAKAHIIGELNASLKKCLSLEIDNFGNIESGKGTIFLKRKIHQTCLHMMFFHLEKRK